MDAVRLQGLTKDFGVGFWRSRPVRALDGVTLEVQSGEVLGYLGPNGSGKTTTLKLLMQLIFPTAGSAEILGRPVGDVGVRRKIGFLPEHPYFYDNLNAEELLVYMARLFGYANAEARRRARGILDRVGVDEVRTPLRKVSKGTLQRIGIAQALINDPEVVFLDEPLSGLDPIGRREMRDIILAFRNEGRTVFLSSHILTDAEAVCSQVAILSRGTLVASGRVADLGLKARGWELVVANVSESQISSLVLAVDRVARASDGQYVVTLPPDRPPQPLMSDLVRIGARIVSLNPRQETLEDFFMARVAASDSSEEDNRASA